ncbi:FtsQ-type POTRA domain-containing protein [uncultured Algimonas sp.]|uniref:cell division protein FtsQ/DivIB n=1 Tax=uncultured Algimonas sp. TaxID=1547920 RepID=UPI00260F3007|nr:FtsQ-type POTRA domain-containing protein [uncultured Algimonas sp.]
MAKKGARPPKAARVSPLKPGLRGASRLVQSRMHAGLRSATRSRASMVRATGSILLTFLALAFLALWLGGHLATVRDTVGDYKRDRLMAMGFTVQRIDVTGEGRLNESDVRAAVGIYEGDYFFGADLDRAQRNTESLPWVDRAVVRRLWPNRIVVQLVETTPYALYQQDGQLHLAARDGSIIAPYAAGLDHLPPGLRLFIGADAVAASGELVDTLKIHPAVWEETETLTLLPSGRWDIRLSDGVVLRLPAEGVGPALRRYAAVRKRSARLEFAVVDLRLPDRVTLTPAQRIDA